MVYGILTQSSFISQQDKSAKHFEHIKSIMHIFLYISTHSDDNDNALEIWQDDNKTDNLHWFSL